MTEDTLSELRDTIAMHQNRLLKWLIGLGVAVAIGGLSSIVGATWWASSIHTLVSSLQSSVETLTNETIPAVLARQTSLERAVSRDILPEAEIRLDELEERHHSLREQLIEAGSLRAER